MSAAAANMPAAAVSATATAMLGERAGREKDGAQEAADQDGELVGRRATLHNFTNLALAENLL
jgi:hypothetical protein